MVRYLNNIEEIITKYCLINLLAIERTLSQRSFLIAAHRCRLLAHIRESRLTDIADALVTEGG